MSDSVNPSRGYLDTPSMGLPVPGTVDAMVAAIERWAAGEADYATWEESMQRCRGLFARLTGVRPGAVGLLGSTGSAVAAAAAVLGRRTGTVIAHRDEFRSLLLPVLARVPESRMRWVSGPYVTETFDAAVDHATTAVIVSAVSSHDGGRPALDALAGRCAEVGADLVVDGTQAAGIVVPDVAVEALSMYVCAGYKGLRCPRGVAFAVAADDLVAEGPVPSPYGAADAAERGTYGPPLSLKRHGRGLDQSPAWLAWVGAEPALADLADQPAQHRENHVLRLAERLRAEVRVRGWKPQPTDLHSPVVSFAAQRPAELVDALADAGVRCAAKRDRVRLGLHTYNDETDVELVCGALDGYLRMFDHGM